MDQKTLSSVGMAEADQRPDAQQNYLYLDQYKLCVEMADRLSSRRVLINNSFITMMGAGAFIYAAARQHFEGTTATYFQLGISLGCVALSAMWYFTIVTYRKIAQAKFKVIQEIENKLPAKPFQMEWIHLSQDDNGQSREFLSLTRIEMYIPILAGIVAASGFLYTLYVLLFHP